MNCSQAGPEPSLYLTGGQLSPGRASLLFIFIVLAVVGFPHPPLHPPPTLAAQGKCRNFNSWQANPWQALSQPADTPTLGQAFAQSPILAETGAQLPSPTVFQCESQNCHTTKGGKTEKCSSDSRYLLST